MGRPVNKKYFGSGPGNQIKVRAKIGSNAEGDGFIVSQRSTNRFKVNIGGTEGICTLVNKDVGSLGTNELTVNVLTDAGQWAQVTKLYNRVAIVEGNQKIKWTFETSSSDGAVEIPDVEEQAYTKTITIGTQPANQAPESDADAVFTVVASGVTDLAYQWQVSTDSGATWTAITGETSATLTVTDTDPEYVDANQFRVVVSSTTNQAAPVTSNAATVTLAPAVFTATSITYAMTSNLFEFDATRDTSTTFSLTASTVELANAFVSELSTVPVVFRVALASDPTVYSIYTVTNSSSFVANQSTLEFITTLVLNESDSEYGVFARGETLETPPQALTFEFGTYA